MNWCPRQDRDYAYRNLQFQYTLHIFSRGNAQKYVQGLRFLHENAPSVLEGTPPLRSFVPSAGIEPAFLPSQGSVRSIERRGLYMVERLAQLFTN